MNNKIFILLFSFFIFSCHSQEEKTRNMINSERSKIPPYNIGVMEDSIKYDYNELPEDIVNYGKSSLRKFNFKFPSDELYIERIKEVFGWNIREYSGNIIVLNTSMFPDIVVRKEKYILFQSPNVNNDFDLYHYNNYIFYNNKQSFNILKIKDYNLLKNLVVNYGYNQDKELLEVVFDSYDFSNEYTMHDLIFKYNHNSLKYEIREYIFDDIETIVYKGRTEDFSYTKKGKGYNSITDIIDKILTTPEDYQNPQKTISYLFDRELRVGIISNIESYLNKNNKYKEDLEKNNFYNLSTLEDYIKFTYKNNGKHYTIHDPDGYTNLRKEKSTKSEIIQQIKSGERIEVLDNSEDWFLIKTKEGKKGYIHKSRIKSDISKPISLHLYSSPNWNSFAQEIKAVGEIEYIHRVSN